MQLVLRTIDKVFSAVSFGAAVATLLIYPIFGHAFDIEPEYQGLSEIERQRIETPREIDREYQSIANSYALPNSWNAAYFKANRALDTTVGSLSNQLFMIYTRAKLETKLNDTLVFQFRYFSQSDREINQTRHILELSQKVSNWIRLNIYGEMAHYKRDNDFGLALLIGPTQEDHLSRWLTRVYVTFHDFTRGNHNDQPDRFLGGDPLTIGSTSTWQSDNINLRAGFRFDRSLKWNIPQEDLTFSYEKKLIFFDASLSVSEDDLISFKFQNDSTFKGREPLPGGTSVFESWRLDRKLLRLSYHRGRESASSTVQYAIMAADRQWIDQNGALIFHQSLLPSVTGRWQTIRRTNDQFDPYDYFQLSIEATDFKTFGDTSLTPASQKLESLEGRLQAAYEFSFFNSSRLLIALNFDLDEWTRVPSFEGGNARFRAEF